MNTFVTYMTGAAVGLVVGVLATVAAVAYLLEQVDRGTTVPTPAVQPSADVIDLHGRRSTRSWSA